MADPEPRTRDELRAARGEIQALRDETFARLEAHSERLATVERIGMQGIQIGRQVTAMVGEIRDGIRVSLRVTRIAACAVVLASLVGAAAIVYLVARR